MVEIINLRRARKQAERRRDDLKADANRIAHGIAKPAREVAEARRAKANRDLAGHRLEGDKS